MAKRTPLIVLGLVVLGAGYWGGKTYLYSRDHVVTDNAQIDGPLIPIAPKILAYADEVRAVDNQDVKAGDTLIVMRSAELAAKVARAQADLDAALALVSTGKNGGQLAAQVAASKATAGAADAAVTSAQAAHRKAAADLERIRGLAAKQIVAAQQLDAAQAAFDATAAALESAERQRTATAAQVNVSEGAIPVADARVSAARAALLSARIDQELAVVTAPVDGTVTKRMVEPGALVQPGQTVMMLVPTDKVWITANVKETRLGKIMVGDTVEFTVDSYGDHQFFGTVQSLSPATGARFALLPPDNATGNFTKVVQNIPIHIEPVRPLDPAFPLRRGMSIEVSIRTPR